MNRWTMAAVVGLMSLAGCAESKYEATTAARMYRAPGAAAPASAEALGESAPMGKMMGMMGGMAGMNRDYARADRPQSAPPAAPPAPKALPRKIIYNADIDLVVDDFAGAERAIARLIAESGGYLAESDLSGMTGNQRTGRWKVRVPVEGFESFLASVARVGDLQRKLINSQDVTDQFYDLEIRIKNKKVEESRLVKHLEDSTGKLSDILEVERELSRVRGEIEQMQGQINLLANLSSLTTVTITIREVRNYVPAAAPTFATRVARRLQGSFDNLRDFLGNLILDFVSILPWLPIWAILLGIAWLIVRRLRAWFRPRYAPVSPVEGAL